MNIKRATPFERGNYPKNNDTARITWITVGLIVIFTAVGFCVSSQSMGCKDLLDISCFK